MANISSLLDIIKNAIYGRDMRGALYDSIKAVNDDVETRLKLSGGTVMGGISMNDNKITSSAIPSAGNDYTNKKYVDEEIAEIKTDLESKKVDKAAGKGLSSNDYTDEEKLKLSGIEPNANNYVLPEDVVKNTDYATANKSGVVVADIVGGISTADNGRLRIKQSEDVDITYRNSIYYPITPRKLNFAVKSALSDDRRISDMTDTEKENARGVIGASSKDELKNLKSLSIPQGKAEGYPAKITDGLAGESPLKLNVYGNSGKNMLKATDFYSALQKVVEKRGNSLYYSELEEDGRNCVRFADCWDAKYQILPFKENTQYTISMDCKTTTRIVNDSTTGSTLFVFFYTDGTRTQVISLKKDTAWTHKTATSAAGKTLSAIGLMSINWRNWCYVDVDTFQLEEGTAATDYEAFDGVGDLNSASGKYEISVSATGKNLLRYPYANKNTTTNGITFKTQQDGTVLINGTASADAVFYIVYTNNPIILKKGKQYTLSRGKSYSEGIILCLQDNSFKQSTWGGTITAEYEKYYAFIKVNSGTTVTNLVLKPQLEEGAAATEYEKYVSGGTLTAALDRQLNSGEYIDFIGKKLVSAVGETDITVRGELEIPETETCYISAGTEMSPEKIEAGYYQDINKVIKEMKNSILSLGGNV